MHPSEERCKQRLEKEGWTTVIHGGPPDFLLIRRDPAGDPTGRIIEVEVAEAKTDGQGLSQSQKLWKEALEFKGIKWRTEPVEGSGALTTITIPEATLAELRAQHQVEYPALPFRDWFRLWARKKWNAWNKAGRPGLERVRHSHPSVMKHAAREYVYIARHQIAESRYGGGRVSWAAWTQVMLETPPPEPK